MGGGFIYTQIDFEEITEDKQKSIDFILSSYKPYKKCVYVYDYEDHSFVGKYNSVNEAAEATGTNRPDISGMLNNVYGHKSRNGYIYSFLPIDDFSFYKRKTNEQKQVIYIYKDAKLYKKVTSRSQAVGITGVSYQHIYNAVKNNSFTSVSGYNFFDHKLEENECKCIRDDRYAGMRHTYHCYDDDGTLIQTFFNTKDIRIFLGKEEKQKMSGLYAAVKDPYNKTYLGYRWSAGDYPINNLPVLHKGKTKIRKNTKVLEIDGIARTISEWVELSGTNKNTIIGRLSRGYPPKEAVFRKTGKNLHPVSNGKELYVTLNGKTKKFTEWCKQYGIKYESARSRLIRGLSYEEIFKKPICRHRNGLVINGEWHSIKEWAAISGIKPSTIYNRLARGVSPEQAVFKELHQGKDGLVDEGE